jgi:uncharacterized protein
MGQNENKDNDSRNGGKKTKNSGTVAKLLVLSCIIVATVGFFLTSGARLEWRVTGDGSVEYSLPVLEYHLGEPQSSNASTMYEISFTSRGDQIQGLLLEPLRPDQVSSNANDNGNNNGNNSIPGKISGIVLLPGSGITKEKEQGLARYLSSLGYATLTLDQRNLGTIDMSGDFVAFSQGQEPTEHKMVADALSAAQVLRSLPEIDADNVAYMGESNGGRFAVMACALDPRSPGVMAISTCGYGVDEVVSSGSLKDATAIRFYRSIDPETYLGKIPPRKLVMIHSRNDPVIPYDLALQMYSNAQSPKELHTLDRVFHGYCTHMDGMIKEGLARMLG